MTNNDIIYHRYLGWKELTEDESIVEVAIFVIHQEIGFSIFRDGHELSHLGWFMCKEDAIENAVERVWNEYAKDEIRQIKEDKESP